MTDLADLTPSIDTDTAVEMELRQPTPPYKFDEIKLTVEVQLTRLHRVREGKSKRWIEEQQSLPVMKT